VAGDFNTGFIAENYAQGFRAEDVPHDDPDFLVALAAFVRRKSRERAAAMSAASCRATVCRWARLLSWSRWARRATTLHPGGRGRG
jgi:hypothetical protein